MFLSPEDIALIGFKSLGTNVKIDSSVSFYHPHNISIGSNVRIDGHCMLTSSASITIGSYVHIAWGCLIYGDSDIIIEDFVGLAPRVSILGSTDDYVSGALTNPTVDRDLRREKRGSVKLCKHVIVGTGSVISPNVTLGMGASVGALSHVVGDLRECMVYLGNPAKPILPRDKERLLQNEEEMLRRIA